jgi:type I restriction enzyme R subunit
MKKNPEQTARDNIDKMLERSGWVVVDKTTIKWSLDLGLAVREYQTDVGPADYVLFVDRKPIGVIEAKKETEGHRLSVHEQQAEFYAQSRLKWFADSYFLPFVYESTGILTQFTDMRDPKPPTLVQIAIGSGKTFTAITRKRLAEKTGSIPNGIEK